MLYRNDDGRHPSLLVENGETVTVSANGAHAAGIPLLTMRPATRRSMRIAGRGAEARATQDGVLAEERSRP